MHKIDNTVEKWTRLGSASLKTELKSILFPDDPSQSPNLIYSLTAEKAEKYIIYNKIYKDNQVIKNAHNFENILQNITSIILQLILSDVIKLFYHLFSELNLKSLNQVC